MYTMDCIDSSCVCKLFEAPNSEEGNQSNVPETVQQNSTEKIFFQMKHVKTIVQKELSRDLLEAYEDKGHCLISCRRLKEDIHRKFDTLINILRERELNLCMDIEKECCNQLEKINQEVTAKCVGKIMKNYQENKKPLETTLVFDSDFDALQRSLKCFGQLKYVDKVELSENMHHKYYKDSNERQEEVALFAGNPFEMATKAASSAKITVPVSSSSPSSLDNIADENGIQNKETISLAEVIGRVISLKLGSGDSSSNEEVAYNSLDEDDIEIISKNEAESIPSHFSFSPPLPRKNRFKRVGKPSCFSSLLRKKGERKSSQLTENSAKSDDNKSEPMESSLKGAVSFDCNSEINENHLSLQEQPGQESCSKFLSGSNDEDGSNNPTAALRSSLTKYLEKNSESEWLSPVKSSEQSLPVVKSPKKRIVPIVQELNQWLPSKYNQNMIDDWLYPACT